MKLSLLTILAAAVDGRQLRSASLKGVCPLDKLPVVCTDNGVKTVRDGGFRKMVFGEECAVESIVRCQEDQDCSSDCGDCPCHYVPNQELSANYMKTMVQQLEPLCSSTDSTRVFMIGLGGGELPQYLLHHCPRMTVETVELNPHVITAAQRYFGLEASHYGERLSVEQGDGLAAVERREAVRYDAVMVDCFAGGGVVPEACRSERFLTGVRRILKPEGGMLLQNIWHKARNHPEVTTEFADTKKLYERIFNGSAADLAVPMPASIRWVDVLKGTRGNVVATTTGGRDAADGKVSADVRDMSRLLNEIKHRSRLLNEIKQSDQ